MNKDGLRVARHWMYRHRWYLYVLVHAIVVAECAVATHLDVHRRFNAAYDLLMTIAAFFLLPSLIAPIFTWKLRRAGKNDPKLALLAVVDLGLDLIHWASIHIGYL